MAEIIELNISDIRPNPNQPRKNFDEAKIDELANSIKARGLINPIQVRKVSGGYEIIAGERRWRAHKKAKIPKIFAIVREESESVSSVDSLIENMHRADLNDLEKAQGLKRIMDLRKISKEELSKVVGLSPHYTTNLLALLEPGNEHLLTSVKSGDIGEHHFRVIKTIKNKDTEKKILKKVISENLGVSKTEELVRAIKTFPKDVSDAIINEEINVEQATEVSKFKSEDNRKHAIQQHRNIKVVEKNIEKNIQARENSAVKRLSEKKLIQIKNVIATFRASSVESAKATQKTIKSLLMCMPFLSVMDEDQIKKLKHYADLWEATQSNATLVAEKLKEKI